MALWRTDTHWYRPIRLTDEYRFFRDMHAGWVACGAIPREPINVNVAEAVLRDYYGEGIVHLLPRRPMWRMFA